MQHTCKDALVHVHVPALTNTLLLPPKSVIEMDAMVTRAFFLVQFYLGMWLHVAIATFSTPVVCNISSDSVIVFITSYHIEMTCPGISCHSLFFLPVLSTEASRYVCALNLQVGTCTLVLFIHTVGVAAPSLHRGSTNSLIIVEKQSVEMTQLQILYLVT